MLVFFFGHIYCAFLFCSTQINIYIIYEIIIFVFNYYKCAINKINKMWLSCNSKTFIITRITYNINKTMSVLRKRNYWRCSRHINRNYQREILQGINVYPKYSSRRFNGSVSLTPESGFIFSTWKAISDSAPVTYVQQSIIEVHDYTGLPWWASIIVTTILFRTLITLPLAIYQQRITARVEMIALEMPNIVKKVKMETQIASRKFHWSEQQTKLMYNESLRNEWNKLVIRDNCHPAKTFIVLWAQIPLWIIQSTAIRNLINMLPDPTSLQAQIVATELTVGGFGWIPNLTDIDHSYILPISLGIINLAIIEIQSTFRKSQPSSFHRIVTNVFRGVSLIIIPVACTVPAALNVYWVSSSCFGLIQNILLVSPKMRRLVGIPKTPTELDHPYKHMWLKLKQKVTFLSDTVETTSNAATSITKTAAYYTPPTPRPTAQVPHKLEKKPNQSTIKK